VVPLLELGVVSGAAVTLRDLLSSKWDRVFQVLPAWRALTPDLDRTVAAHGDSARWLAHLAALPALTTDHVQIGATIDVGRPDEITAADRQSLSTHLLALQPWRKGPFALFGVAIDTEWRSDWKWHRVAPHLSGLAGRRVLDVGCGNGYYGWRMCAAGAHLVVGVDPTLVYLMQYLALLRYLAPARPHLDNVVLPARLEDLPASAGAFDTVFSMGVLYHRKDPVAHLGQLAAQLRPGGELVVESLIISAEEGSVLIPQARYARMRNVRQIPSAATLTHWIGSAGFHSIRIVDVTPTTVAEQRTTPWMPLQSLAEALDPADSRRTIEGLPAPVRAVVIATK
jgi:tRNA (mo5U34)-methyltransferase